LDVDADHADEKVDKELEGAEVIDEVEDEPALVDEVQGAGADDGNVD